MALQDRIRTFKEGFVGGIGWAFGVTIGFLIISAILWFILNRLGGIPFVNDRIRPLIEATTESTYTRTPVIPE